MTAVQCLQGRCPIVALLFEIIPVKRSKFVSLSQDGLVSALQNMQVSCMAAIRQVMSLNYINLRQLHKICMPPLQYVYCQDKVTLN